MLRALPLPAARAEACGCRPPHARRLRVRRRLSHAARPPNTRLTPACRVCRLQPESEVVPYRAGASRGYVTLPSRGYVTLVRRSRFRLVGPVTGVRCNLHRRDGGFNTMRCIGEGRAKRGFGQRCSVRSAARASGQTGEIRTTRDTHTANLSLWRRDRPQSLRTKRARPGRDAAAGPPPRLFAPYARPRRQCLRLRGGSRCGGRTTQPAGVRRACGGRQPHASARACWQWECA